MRRSKTRFMANINEKSTSSSTSSSSTTSTSEVIQADQFHNKTDIEHSRAELERKRQALMMRFPPLINKSVEDEARLMHRAAMEGDLEIVRDCCENRGIDVNIQNTNLNNQRTALHWAVKNGHVDIVQYLIFKGASINILDAQKKTALTYAYENNDKKAALLDALGISECERTSLIDTSVGSSDDAILIAPKVNFQKQESVRAYSDFFQSTATTDQYFNPSSRESGDENVQKEANYRFEDEFDDGIDVSLSEMVDNDFFNDFCDDFNDEDLDDEYIESIESLQKKMM